MATVLYKIYAMSKILPFKIIAFFLVLSLISCSKDNEDPASEPVSEITVTTSNFVFSIDENPEDGEIIGTVTGNSNQGTVMYSISEESAIGALSIDETSGVLKVANGFLFDYEINPVITGIVKVSNGTIFENAAVTINLNDLDDVFDGYVFLKTQEEVNSFGANNYKEINGSLIIGDPDETGETNISDLSPLNSLKTINNYLQIIGNPLLVSTSGLNIYEIKQGIYIWDNPLLEKIKGLNKISYIYELVLANNPVLSDFSGINQITKIDYQLFLSNCPLMPNLDWLSNLTESGATLYVIDCHSLTNLDGLSNLTTLIANNNVENSIVISGNNALVNLDGLVNINSPLYYLEIKGNPSLLNIDGLRNMPVTQQFSISNNDLLQNLNGLSSIKQLRKYASIIDNNSLVNLRGLENLESCEGMIISDNPNLTSLDGLNGLKVDQASMRVNDNINLTDFCSLHYTYNGYQGYECQGNAYNPTLQDLLDGNCRL